MKAVMCGFQMCDCLYLPDTQKTLEHKLPLTVRVAVVSTFPQMHV